MIDVCGDEERQAVGNELRGDDAAVAEAFSTEGFLVTKAHLHHGLGDTAGFQSPGSLHLAGENQLVEGLKDSSVSGIVGEIGSAVVVAMTSDKVDISILDDACKRLDIWL